MPSRSNCRSTLAFDELAERAVAGALLGGFGWDRLGSLETVDVIGEQEREVIRVVLNLRDRGEIAVDPLAVIRELEHEGRLSPAWSSPTDAAAYMSRLMDECPSGLNVGAAAQQIVAASLKRKAALAAKNLAADFNDPTAEAESLIESAKRVADLLSNAKRTAPPSFPVVSARELATTDYPLEYMIPSLLVKGQPLVIGGGKKSLKTTLLIALVLALSSHCKFLGEFYVTRRYRCALMSGESGEATIKETAERVARSMPWIDLKDYTDLLFSFTVPKLGLPNSAAELTRFVKDNGIEFLAIDPLYLAMSAGDGASNLYTMGDKLSPLTEVIAETGCTICLAHHARKVAKSDAMRFQPPELDDLAFAGISEYARQWLLINRREEYDPENGGSHRMWLTAGGSAGHSGIWGVDIEEGTRQTPGGRFWQVSVCKASEVRREAKDTKESAKAAREQERRQRDEQRVLDAYRAFPKGETANVIRTAAGMSGDKFNGVNFSLQQRSVVVACHVEKDGRNRDGFTLKEFVKTPQSDELDKSDKPTGVRTVRDASESDRTDSLFRESGCPSDSRTTESAPTNKHTSEEFCPSDLPSKKTKTRKPSKARKTSA